MKKFAIHIIAVSIILSLCLSACCKKDKSIVVLFENDVHCHIDGYAELAGLRDAVKDTAFVAVVSSGDFLQGGTIGAISTGQYIIDVMKLVGYDAVTLGNHEFDYKIPRMLELLSQLDGTTVVSANLCEIETEKLVFAPYIIKEYGKRKVAFLGVTTPTTTESEAYAFFDGQDTQRYDLMQLIFYETVQKQIDAARSEGADYVVVLAHLGEEPNGIDCDSRSFIAKTTGVDVVLDAHSHNVISARAFPNKDGKPVLTTNTGTQFLNIGKLLISPDGKMSIELIPSEKISVRNEKVQQAIDSVKAMVSKQVGRVVCHSEVDLRILDDAGTQLVRREETNAGDIVTDAYRVVTGADIAITNGGGIRNEAKAGDLTYGDIVSMLPYDNQIVMLEVKGEKIVEVLKENCATLPLEDGQFPQVSGLRYTVVVSDHSIRNVQVLNQKTGKYEPLDPNKTYTLATTDYCVTGGGLRNVLKGSKIVRDGIIIYYEVLVDYVEKHLNGHIGQEYAQPQGRIKIIQS